MPAKNSVDQNLKESTAQHTPGPWKYAPAGLVGYEKWLGEIIAMDGVDTGNHIASIVDWPNHLANAHLIAAAPDLLAACEAALLLGVPVGAAYGTEGVDHKDIFEQLRAAIAKAGGAS